MLGLCPKPRFFPGFFDWRSFISIASFIYWLALAVDYGIVLVWLVGGCGVVWLVGFICWGFAPSPVFFSSFLNGEVGWRWRFCRFGRKGI